MMDKMVRELIILGAGGFGREASLLIEEINASGRVKEKWRLLGFIDDDESKWGTNQRGYPVLGGFAALAAQPGEALVIAVVGDPQVKRRLVETALEQGRSFATLIHPEVAPAHDVRIGKGALIAKGVVLTTNITIEDHVSINPSCGIGHDSVVGAYSTLLWRVNISGAVQVGPSCLLGSGAVVLQGKHIGAGSIIGAGAVVTADLPAGCTAVGVPARVV